ncbi:glycosyltransferase family 2 protein [Streptomyces olivoreticuli]
MFSRKNTRTDISVVMAVRDSMPYLTDCLNSIILQTLDPWRLEVIAVDDGSTDGSAAELDRFALKYPHIQVVHQPRSAVPGQPRNRALDLARGRYVFVMGSGDYLGREAFERMLAMADKQGSDIVLGKVVGAGRDPYAKAYRHTGRADLYTSEVYNSLDSMKLIRRAILERPRIRYPEDLWLGEDQLFMTEAYLAARSMSVVGDYDCYFLRRRTTGKNTTALKRTAHERIVPVERAMALIDARVIDTLGRRRLLANHFRTVIDKAVLPILREEDSDAAAREEILRRGRELCRLYWDESMAAEIPAITWLRLYCLIHGHGTALERLARYHPEHDGVGKELVENGRIYRPYPFFRRPSAGIPDTVFDITDRLRARRGLTDLRWEDGQLEITGYAYIDRLDARDLTTRLILRRRGGEQEWKIPVESTPTPRLTLEHGMGRYDYGNAGWKAALSLETVAAGNPLGPGVWDLFVQVEAQQVVKEARLTPPYHDGWQMPGGRDLGDRTTTAVPYRAEDGNLTFDVGGTHRTLTAHARLATAKWAGDLLHLHGSCWIDNVPASEVRADVFLRHRDTGDEIILPTTAYPIPPDPAAGSAPRGIPAELAFRASCDPLAVNGTGPLPEGLWDAHVWLRASGVHRDARLKALSTLPAGDMWRLRLLPGAQDDSLHLVTPYLAEGRYAAIDAGGRCFTPHSQLLISRVRRNPHNHKEVIVQGRVGVKNIPEGGLRLQVADRKGNRYERAVHLAPPSTRDPLPKPGGSERHTGQWPAFTTTVETTPPRFARATVGVKLQLTIGGRTFDVLHGPFPAAPAAHDGWEHHPADTHAL